ncbi:MAG: hypothetical protein K2M54_08130, partial [Muribaculaceae bacterium]|nr:hypothetical protein [Muribaculaceae bacterium]
MTIKTTILTVSLAACGLLTGCAPKAETEQALPEKDMSLQLYSIREVIGDSTLYADNHESV